MVVEDSKIWGNGNAGKDPKGNHLKCSNISNDDFAYIMDTTFAQQNEVVVDRENIDVDITERTNLDRIRYGLVEAGCQDTTESSSSFEESISGVDESDDFCGDATSAVASGEANSILSTRTRKVTSHWSSFIKPIEWRCKWVELQLWKLKSLAQKYDKELAQYSDKNQFESENFGLDDTNSKSTPFPFAQQRNKVLGRKRRRRNEDRLDIAEYMSKHNLFSFYENRKSAADDGAFRNDDQFNPVVCTEKVKSSNELKLDEESVQHMRMDRNNSTEQIHRKIDGLQSQVSGLKARLGKVMSENAAKFTCVSNTLTNSQNLHGLSMDNEDRMIEGSPIANQLLAEFSKDDIMIEGSPIPIANQLLAEFSKDDIMIEGSPIPIATQLLAEYCKDGVTPYREGLTASTDQSLVVGTRVNNEDVFMIYDYRMKERMRSFQEVEIQPEEKAEIIEGGRGQRSAIPPVLMEPLEDQSARGLLSIPKNQNNKGRGQSISSARNKRF